ncbi:MAG: hypothetical protein EBY17_12865 [Acidobacteriia bacterium]|nr:hypothetical protein [Terriglobia bacterium]
MRTLIDYTAHDVTPEDRTPYAAHVDLWQTELQPNGALECYFAAEIVRAAWRLERYSPLGPQAGPQAEISPASSSLQARAAWLRYRDQTNLGVRRNLEELRRLQSDRYLQAHLGILLPGVASLKTLLPGLKLPKKQAQPEATNQPDTPDPPTVADSEATLHAQLQEEERRELNEYFKDNPDETPEQVASPAPVPLRPAAGRNALCPCNSGLKYKRCCGHWSKVPPPKTL